MFKSISFGCLVLENLRKRKFSSCYFPFSKNFEDKKGIYANFSRSLRKSDLIIFADIQIVTIRVATLMHSSDSAPNIVPLVAPAVL